MAELGGNFYDSLKSLTAGYASFDYEEGEARKADLVRLDLLLNGEAVDAMARIVHRWGHSIHMPLGVILACRLEHHLHAVPLAIRLQVTGHDISMQCHWALACYTVHVWLARYSSCRVRLHLEPSVLHALLPEQEQGAAGGQRDVRGNEGEAGAAAVRGHHPGRRQRQDRRAGDAQGERRCCCCFLLTETLLSECMVHESPACQERDHVSTRYICSQELRHCMQSVLTVLLGAVCRRPSGRMVRAPSPTLFPVHAAVHVTVDCVPHQLVNVYVQCLTQGLMCAACSPGKVLRRRRVAQAQAAGEAEGGQEAHAPRRLRGCAAGGVSCAAEAVMVISRFLFNLEYVPKGGCRDRAPACTVRLACRWQR